VYKGNNAITLDQHEENMVRFFRRQLAEGQYKLRKVNNDRTYIHMYKKVFNQEDLKDFATHGRFCSGDMVKISAMCLYEGIKKSPSKEMIKHSLMVIDDNDMELLLQYADTSLEMANAVWRHINQCGTVLAVILSRPRGSHWVGGFVTKIKTQSFVINTRDSNPSCGADAKAYCKSIKRMVNRCADVSAKTGLKLKFRVQKRPSWTSRQAGGANNCGHYQASSCLLAAMGLLETHKLNAAFVEQCRRYTLFQILKKDSELTTPYRSSQLCSGRPVEIRTRDVLVKKIADGEKDVECRPAYPSLNNMAPGTKVRFCSQQVSCNKVVVKIERFATFYEGLQHAGMDRCLPGFCGGVSDAVQFYFSLHDGYSILERKLGVILLYLADITEFEETPIARTTSVPVPTVVDTTNAAAAVTVAVATNDDVNTKEKTDTFEDLDWNKQ